MFPGVDGFDMGAVNSRLLCARREIIKFASHTYYLYTVRVLYRLRDAQKFVVIIFPRLVRFFFFLYTDSDRSEVRRVFTIAFVLFVFYTYVA